MSPPDPKPDPDSESTLNITCVLDWDRAGPSLDFEGKMRGKTQDVFSVVGRV